MNIFEGLLTKMKSTYENPISYSIDGMDVPLNNYLNQSISLNFIEYCCLNCRKKIKIYRQGHCYKCFFNSPTTANWVIKPEESKAHMNIEERDLDYEKEMQLQPHIVYIANSSHVKVGITKKKQIPTRWIDQGAIQALPIMEMPNRYLAGIAEVSLKEHISDKTNWRKMLTNQINNEDLFQVKSSLIKHISTELEQYIITNPTSVDIQYPVLKVPDKVKSLTLNEKSPYFSETLVGIKGQYLIFSDNTVFNIRNNEGKIVVIQKIN